ncbi:MAG: hypothetical protein ACH350_09450 [Parachlamydiaceae bacterium]
MNIALFNPLSVCHAVQPLSPQLKSSDLRSFTAQDLFDVAQKLRSNQAVAVVDGIGFTKQELYIKAITLDPNFSEPYYFLGCLLPSDGSVELPKEGRVGKQQLYLKSIQLNRRFARAYCELAETLTEGRKIELLKNIMMSQSELYRIAIYLDCRLAKAYFNLGMIVGEGSSIELVNEGKISGQALLLKARELDHTFFKADHCLFYILSNPSVWLSRNSAPGT